VEIRLPRLWVVKRVAKKTAIRLETEKGKIADEKYAAQR